MIEVHHVVSLPGLDQEFDLRDMTVGELQAAGHFAGGKPWQQLDPLDAGDLGAIVLVLLAQRLDPEGCREALAGKRLALDDLEIRVTASLEAMPAASPADGDEGDPDA